MLQHAGNAAEEGDEHVVDGRPRARQQLRGVAEPQRRYEEVQARHHYADAHHHHKILEAVLEETRVVGAQAEAEADDGPHHGGYEHGADDDRNGIDIQAYRRYDYCACENDDVGPPEVDVLLDGGRCRRPVYIVFKINDMTQILL